MIEYFDKRYIINLHISIVVNASSELLDILCSRGDKAKY